MVSEALVDAERSALTAHRLLAAKTGGGPQVVTGPADTSHLEQAGIDSDEAHRTAGGELDTAWAACTDHGHHPGTGERCGWSFLDCFHCGNCLITRDHLPGLLALLDTLNSRRERCGEADWWARYGMTWTALRREVLPKFSPAEIAEASTRKPADALLDLVEQTWQHP
ncbi:MAG TPA: hypothetical protein VFG35_00845 [Actinoplanes sp.]|nr:hypothetical protein [Actinoplanes sp.]